MKILDNASFKLYNEMMDGYNLVNENKFVHGAMHLAAKDWKNPFQDEVADMHYSMMAINYKKWLKRGVDYRVSKRRLLEHATRLAELDLPSPFVEDEVMSEGVSYEQLKMDEFLRAEQEDIQSETYVPVYEAGAPEMHILGVMPECEVE